MQTSIIIHKSISLSIAFLKIMHLFHRVFRRVFPRLRCFVTILSVTQYNHFMIIRRFDLRNCTEARGCVVSIDVLRAFTTAAYAFAAGAAELLCTDSTEAALRLKRSHPGSLAMGEESDGADIGFFEMNNSPFRLREHDLRGRTIIHRTTSGTVGLVRPQEASHLLACSLVNAAATVRYIRTLGPQELDLIETGIHPGGRGDEDTACADYIESILQGEPIPEDQIIYRVLHSEEIRFFEKGDVLRFPTEDLDLAVRIGCFDFAMTGTRLAPDCVRLKAVPVL